LLRRSKEQHAPSESRPGSGPVKWKKKSAETKFDQRDVALVNKMEVLLAKGRSDIKKYAKMGKKNRLIKDALLKSVIARTLGEVL